VCLNDSINRMRGTLVLCCLLLLLFPSPGLGVDPSNLLSDARSLQARAVKGGGREWSGAREGQGGPYLSGNSGKCWPPFWNLKASLRCTVEMSLPTEGKGGQAQAYLEISSQKKGNSQWVHRVYVGSVIKFLGGNTQLGSREFIDREILLIQEDCDGIKETILPREMSNSTYNSIAFFADHIPLTLPVTEDGNSDVQEFDAHGSPRTRSTRRVRNDDLSESYTVRKRTVNGQVVLNDGRGFEGRNQTETLRMTMSANKIIELTWSSEARIEPRKTDVQPLTGAKKTRGSDDRISMDKVVWKFGFKF